MKAKIYIYRNLTKKCFSIKYKGKVTHHVDTFVALNCTLKVNEAGKLRVRKEKQKNVHAYVVADTFFIPFVIPQIDDLVEITYNPYVNDTFVDVLTGEELYNEGWIYGINGKIYRRK